MHQSAWQDIQFSDIAGLSSRTLAGPELYQAFYEELVRRYHSWDQVSPTRRKEGTRREYQSLMRRADYDDVQDGFIDPATCFHYWIAGR